MKKEEQELVIGSVDFPLTTLREEEVIMITKNASADHTFNFMCKDLDKMFFDSLEEKKKVVVYIVAFSQQEAVREFKTFLSCGSLEVVDDDNYM